MVIHYSISTSLNFCSTFLNQAQLHIEKLLNMKISFSFHFNSSKECFPLAGADLQGVLHLKTLITILFTIKMLLQVKLH